MKPIRMLLRSIRDAFKSVVRNFSLSLASISCISITLIIVALSVIISANVNNFGKLIKEEVTIVVFVKNEVDEAGINTIKAKLDQIDNISDIVYISKDELKKQMMESDKGFEIAMKDWNDENNPLKNNFKIKVKELEKIDETNRQIKNIEGVDTTDYGEEMVNNFLKTLKFLEKGVIVAVIALVIVTVFLIINTIKLTIFSRKREISIMRLVGASNFTIKMPFVVEGMVLGLMGSIVPILIVIYGYFAFYENYDGKLMSSLFQLVKPAPFVYMISLVIILLGIVVGMLGSYRAVRKYLKV